MNAPVRRPSSAPPSSAHVRVGDDHFVSEALLEAWMRVGEASCAGGLMTARDGRRWLVRDGLRILGRRNGETDPYGLTGRVETLRDFLRKGGMLGPDAVRLGAAIYDVEYGVIAYLMKSPDESGAMPKMFG
jgi:hypothetical protein